MQAVRLLAVRGARDREARADACPAGQETRTSRLVCCGSPAFSRTWTVEIATFVGSFVPARIGLPISALPPASVPVACLRSTCSVPATLPERCATTSVVAAPPASTAQQPAVTASLEVAAAPPPIRCRTPASGPIPIGGTSARRRERVALRLSRNSRQAPQVLQVAQGVLGRAAALVVGGQQDVADRGAVGVARLGGGDQPGPRALDQLARRRGRDLQRARDLARG